MARLQTKRIDVYLSEKDHGILRKLANEECESMSLLVRRAVKEYIRGFVKSNIKDGVKNDS